MNITFTPQPIPELAIDGGTLAGLGFTPGPPLQLTLRPDGLWITPVTDAEQLEITAAPGVIRLQRRENEVFKA
ncbi:TPA: hypothetical protein ACIAIE_002648 [Serratia fonticola]|uniref:hypothetical protein n=1 Tax=Serratia fonticola TaxID=47917 RepID=UPI001377E1D8|nr:hypothetical protein [Serratia fonticola]MBC3228399.1 hypothetical protein [Serratia fonticola]NBJ32320.1 hypothetical protein [Serratia fonticola]